jgi:signal transduction histidine kinase
MTDPSPNTWSSPELLIPRLGDQLVEMGLLSAEQLKLALGYQHKCAEKGRQVILGQAIMELGFLDRPTLDQAVTGQILRLRSALEDANHNLELRVQQRTLELEEALRRLSESNQLKANFLSNISHELRTPLTHIRGYLDLLNAGSFGDLDPDQKQAVDISLQASLRLQTLIDDLILFSQSSRGQMILTIAPLDLNKVARNMHIRYKRRAADHQLVLEENIDPGLPLVQADEEKLSWVIAHLLGNAIKFTNPGGKINLTMLKDPVNTEKVTISVADTGIGISQDSLKEIFEPFYQLDGSATRRYGGTGLGLALVLQIIEAHGSRINVKSEINKGTTVSFLLPTSKVE